jgi:hypothetical protein
MRREEETEEERIESFARCSRIESYCLLDIRNLVRVQNIVSDDEADNGGRWKSRTHIEEEEQGNLPPQSVAAEVARIHLVRIRSKLRPYEAAVRTAILVRSLEGRTVGDKQS